MKCKGQIDAVVEAFANGTAILVTDGSYKRKVRSDLCGAGWLIYCTDRQSPLLEGSFYDICNKARSYRGELLGLLALHVFTRKLESFYGFEEGHKAVIACDNLGGLNKSKERRKKIPPSAKNADILRSLRKLHAQTQAKLTYQHVYGHQDKNKRWDQMTIFEQLNYWCDILVKAAVDRGILAGEYTVGTAQQRLPLEAVAIFHDGRKLSSECGSDIRYHIVRVDACELYITQLEWYAAVFDYVDWKAQDKILSRKPDMFRIWICKQVSGFNSCGKNMKRWFGSEHSSCPNCGKQNEDTTHLLHCPDAGRFAHFREEVNKLSEWLSQTHTDPLLNRIITKYILARGASQLADFPNLPPEQCNKFFYEQDLIGWENFMLGMVLLSAPSMMNVDDWLSQLIDKLLHATHGQWKCKNISKHHATLGSIKKAEQRQMLLEIDRLLQVSPEDVPEDSKFLLEIDFSAMRYADTTAQIYWVHAVKAAMIAGRRCIMPYTYSGPVLCWKVIFLLLAAFGGLAVTASWA